MSDPHRPETRVTISKIDVPFMDIVSFVFQAAVAVALVGGVLFVIYAIARPALRAAAGG